MKSKLDEKDSRRFFSKIILQKRAEQKITRTIHEKQGGFDFFKKKKSDSAQQEELITAKIVFHPQKVNILEIGSRERISRMYNKVILSSFMALLFVVPVSAWELTRQHKIVIPLSATPCEFTAAGEFKKAVAAMTGQNLEIVSAKKLDSPAVYIGISAAMNQKPDEILIRTDGNNLYLSGSAPRGMIYSVCTLLEEYCGVHFWTSFETEYPHLKKIVLPELDIRYSPPFISRGVNYFDIDKNGIFAARRKINGHWNFRIGPDYGGNETVYGFAHTFDLIIPPKQYFMEHPDYFAEVKKKRRSTASQLCLSNREMRQEFIKRAIQFASHRTSNIVSISQDDGGGECTCQNCTELMKRNDWNQTDLLLDFVNEVAEALDRTYPGIWVETLSYDYTKEPPRHVSARENVRVKICASDNDLMAWSKKAPTFSRFFYAANFHNFLIPYPINWKQVAKSFRIAAAHNVNDIFVCVDNGSGKIGDFVQMKAWIFSKMCYNPYLDPEVLRKEFINGYYGPAATKIKEYWTLMDQAAFSHELRENDLYNLTWLTLKKNIELLNIMKDASAAVAGNEPYASRVKRAGLPIAFALLLREESFNPLLKSQYQWTDKDLVTLAKETLETARLDAPERYSELERFDNLSRQLEFFYGIGSSHLPDDFPQKTRGKIIILPCNLSRIYEQGKVTFEEPDKEAITQKVVKLLTKQSGWWVQQPILMNFSKCKVMLRLKMIPEKIDGKGSALYFGLYSTVNKKVSGKKIQFSDLQPGKYIWVDAGSYELNTGDYFYFSPFENKEIMYFLLDSIVLVTNSNESLDGSRHGMP